MVPNRGEIAVRIARTCREMGIASVLAHAEDDIGIPAGRLFDSTVSLGTGDARETYLDVASIIDAARTSRADAIHPGYGFLSERAELAAACEEIGIVFIGPRSDSIELVGSKAASRTLMERAGVPVVPGYHGDDQSDETLVDQGERIGFPLLVKASAGGGGKGMKVVRSAGELVPAIESARREALKAFGDERLLLERFIERPRHVEIQIFGDAEGNMLHLFERDCSIQRRHQKVIEETPAPHYSSELREKMSESAISAARAAGYVNAGTVEFLLTDDGHHYFLEMNTRLQVEHPVTEMALGIDLVRAQILVAGGERTPWNQEDLAQRGHAVECRIYAEDPDDRFLPQTGTISVYREPSGPGIRVDSGIAAGSEVSVHYDPLLAKVIAHGETREASIARLAAALSDYPILGVKTNASFLRRVIMHPSFIAGEVDTELLVRHAGDLALRPPDAHLVALAAVLGEQRSGDRKDRAAGSGPSIPSVWETIGNWRG
ncbi:MAG TPA: biotin carboxylase N-terminal domain-containing protein [Thermoanaerobaculia bacterium]|nr:biotin carboxylase N-terminal domain-containing protein [Thermoanaerobaculia bacterium]